MDSVYDLFLKNICPDFETFASRKYEYQMMYLNLYISSALARECRNFSFENIIQRQLQIKSNFLPKNEPNNEDNNHCDEYTEDVKDVLETMPTELLYPDLICHENLAPSIAESEMKEEPLEEVPTKGRIVKISKKYIACYTYKINERNYIKIVRAQERLIRRIDNAIIFKHFKENLPKYLGNSYWIQCDARKLYAIECKNPIIIWNRFFGLKYREFSTVEILKSNNTTLLLLTEEELLNRYKRQTDEVSIWFDNEQELLEKAILTPEKFVNLLSSHFK